MKYLNYKDKKKRLNFNKVEILLVSKKYLIQNKTLPLFCIKFQKQTYYNNNHKRSYISEIMNRCILSFKSRSVYRKFKLSRMFLRQYLSFGYIVGYRKSSW